MMEPIIEPREAEQPVSNDADCSKALLKAPVVFGLRNQGHIPTIDRMLNEGHNWSSIASAIGWCRETARADYEKLVGNSQTRQLRSVLAESVELVRVLNLRFGNRLDVTMRNRMSEAYLRGTNLLESKTHYDFDSP